jgi:hypothetical protein
MSRNPKREGPNSTRQLAPGLETGIIEMGNNKQVNYDRKSTNIPYIYNFGF